MLNNTISSTQYSRPRMQNQLCMRVRSSAFVVALVLGCSFAQADELSAIEATNDDLSSLITLGDASSSLGTTELGEQRAKAMLEIDKVIINEQELNGSVSDNVAINTRSGSNVITNAAFSDASGIINSIQNTGNNVLIQSATIVNVSIER